MKLLKRFKRSKKSSTRTRPTSVETKTDDFDFETINKMKTFLSEVLPDISLDICQIIAQFAATSLYIPYICSGLSSNKFYGKICVDSSNGEIVPHKSTMEHLIEPEVCPFKICNGFWTESKGVRLGIAVVDTDMYYTSASVFIYKGKYVEDWENSSLRLRTAFSGSSITIDCVEPKCTLKLEDLSTVRGDERIQLIEKHLYPRVQEVNADLAGGITGVFLQSFIRQKTPDKEVLQLLYETPREFNLIIDNIQKFDV